MMLTRLLYPVLCIQLSHDWQYALSGRFWNGCRESFFANCRMRGGYSGVATFCRAGSCMPVAALDGFSGVLPQSSGKPRDTPASTPVQEALSNPCSALFERCGLHSACQS